MLPPEPLVMPSGFRLRNNRHGRLFLHIDHPKVSASIALEGAHILQCTPSGQNPLLWVSSEEEGIPGMPLRGGVPICWPWFGDTRPGPAHGIARTSLWTLTKAESNTDEVRVCMALDPAVIATQLHDEQWQVNIEFVMSSNLQVTLTTLNDGQRSQPLSQALHTYLPVSDIRQAQITGLAQSRYIDQLSGTECQQQQALLTLSSETDRVYYDHTDPVMLDDGQAGRLVVSREGSGSLVVWNPWIDKSLKLSHFPSDGYLHMLCLEAANTGPDSLWLAPGQSHQLVTRISRS